MYRILLGLALISIGVAGCNKNRVASYVIRGQITDPNLNTPIAGATVTLRAQEVIGSTLSSSFKVLATTTTAANGTYTIQFDRVNATEYRIEVEKDLYFGTEESINPDDLKTSEMNVYSYEIGAQSWIHIHLKNQNPANANDEVTYQMNPGAAQTCGPSCCTSLAFTLEGETVDTTWVCTNTGGHDATLNAYYVKNGIGGTVSQTVYVQPFDTTFVTLFY